MTLFELGFWAVAALASPTVYILDYANGKAIARPMTKEMAGLSMAALNGFRQTQNPSLRPSAYCYVEQMRKDALVSPLRKEQEIIDRLLGEVPHASFDMNTKAEIRLTVGIYEKCEKFSEDDDLSGSVLVATKAGRIVWMEEFPALLPIYLLPPRGKELAVIASCLACGAISELYYDPANDKFYIQYVGD